jgi:hypothetical protein
MNSVVKEETNYERDKGSSISGCKRMVAHVFLGFVLFVVILMGPEAHHSSIFKITKPIPLTPRRFNYRSQSRIIKLSHNPFYYRMINKKTNLYFSNAFTFTSAGYMIRHILRCPRDSEDILRMINSKNTDSAEPWNFSKRY